MAIRVAPNGGNVHDNNSRTGIFLNNYTQLLRVHSYNCLSYINHTLCALQLNEDRIRMRAVVAMLHGDHNTMMEGRPGGQGYNFLG